MGDWSQQVGIALRIPLNMLPVGIAGTKRDSYTDMQKTMESSSQEPVIVAKTLYAFWLLAGSILMMSLAASAQDLAAGTALEARLSVTTGSRISHSGDPIEATIIAPVSVRGRIVIPQGSRLLGSITNVTAVRLGLKRSTASVTYRFQTLVLPDGTAIPVNARTVEIDTAKEHVDDLGTVTGIPPIASFSSAVSFYVVPLLLLNPPIGTPIWGMKSVIAPSANPEIRFPAGTELILRLSATVTLPASATAFGAPTRSFSPRDLTEVEQLLKNSAQRAHMGGRPSDMVNLLLMGSRSQLDRVFYASGWVQAQRKSPIALYRMYLALAKRIGYPRAPMNALTLNQVPSAFVQQKGLNTVQKRHHVRIWQYPGRTDIWLAAAAEDVGFRFKMMHWTHSTDPNIDSERAKVVNDLAFSGCVEAAGLLSRDSKDLVQDPKAEYPIVTDGDIALVRLNDCVDPKPMAGVSETSASRQRGRVARTLAVFRDELARSNILFTTYNTFRFLGRHRARPKDTHTQVVNGGPRELDWLPPIIPLENLPVQ